MIFRRQVPFILLAAFVAGCSMFGSEDTEVVEAIDITAEEDFVEVPPTTLSPLLPTDLDWAVKVRDLPSPNFDKRTSPVSLIVLHYTAAPLRESLNALRNGRTKNRVSAHYVVATDGTIYRLVDEANRAWHAGVSSWKNITDVNSASIGIEMVNLGHDKNGKQRPYPKEQIEAVIRLCLSIQSRYVITDVVGHSDVAPIRKIDPGELFPWKMLADRGVKVRKR